MRPARTSSKTKRVEAVWLGARPEMGGDGSAAGRSREAISARDLSRCENYRRRKAATVFVAYDNQRRVSRPMITPWLSAG